jgi:transcriptional regulator with XRE-family HTH domain
MTAKEFGRKIRVLRVSAGISQAKMADDLGIQNCALSRYENGHHFPNFSIARKIAQYLAKRVKFDLSELLEVN